MVFFSSTMYIDNFINLTIQNKIMVKKKKYSQITQTSLKAEMWYKQLIADLIMIKVKSAIDLIRRKHEFGTRILEDKKKLDKIYGKEYVKELSEDTKTSERDIWRCIQFASKFTEQQLDEKLTQMSDLTWSRIVKEYLPEWRKGNFKIPSPWIWDKTIEEFVKPRVKGYSLNVCAGKSSIGDVKIDLNPQNKSVKKGNMNKLQFGNNTFDTVIEDPPWKIGFYKRMKPFFECVRVCKVGGQIIYNAYWIPTSKQVKRKELWLRQDSDWTNCSVISVFEKIKGDEKSKLNMKKVVKVQKIESSK